MPCESPRRAYPAAIGGRVRFFQPTDKQYYIEPYTGLLVPCGVCILCRAEQARQWAVRITHEASLHSQNCFATFTYDENHLPTNGQLEYKHLTDFWKRLRYHIGELSYYSVGEYGDKSNRPHYHACIFGHDFYEGSVIIKEGQNRLWTSAWLNSVWGHGHVTIGTLNYQTAAYTAQYVLKKQRTKQRYCTIDTTTGELLTVPAPRSFMSRNIARSWWNQWNQGVQDWDRVVINSRPQKPPRAYDKWLGENNKTKIEEIKQKRIEKIKTKTKEQNRAHAHNARARERQRIKSV